MRYALLALLLATSLTCAFADDPPAKDETTVKLTTVVVPEERLTKRVFFVVDVSGSMKATVPQMIGAIGGILEQPIDDFDVAVVVFNDSYDRWPGYNDPKDKKPAPAGWAKFPSATAMNVATAWLCLHPGNGGTNPVGAMELALKEKRDDLSVILITDGIFEAEPLLTKIKECQDWRVKQGYGNAVIVSYGIGTESAKKDHLAQIGREWGGGFFVEEARERKAPAGPVILQSQSISPVITPAKTWR